MKIFISYAHNDHTALVDALFDALIKEGHEPWKDDRYEGRSGIPAGEDFTRVIYDTILDSDFVIAFATAKSMSSRYCSDERQYAYNAKGSRFIQLRLDGVDIRLGNSGSYIDMSGVELGGGRLNEELLCEKLQALYAALRNPMSLVSPSAKFERYLRIPGALQYDDFITMPAKDDFVGREWLQEQCKRWAMDESIPCRLFVILGEAGTGKTAFVRHLATDRELVRSVHVCVFDRPKTRNVTDTLKNLAYTLTTTNPEYGEFLKNKDFEQLKDLDFNGLFEFLFIEPLKNETRKYLLIIDGLDELEENTGLNPLIQLLRQYAEVINPNISILVTGRPDENIVSKLRTVNLRGEGQSVTLSKENGGDDLHAFIRKNLLALGCHSDALQEKIFQACDGNFEYLTLLFREVKEEGLALTGDMTLPKGLRERYTQYLDRRMERNRQDECFTREQQLLLSVLGAAFEPIPLSLLADACAMDEFEAERELLVFGSLIRKTSGGEDASVAFFSKGFRDYLLSRSCPRYGISAAAGHRALARRIMKKFTAEKAFARLPYADRHAFTHLLVYMNREREEVENYLAAMKEKAYDNVQRRLTDALCSGEPEALEAVFGPEGDKDEKDRMIILLKARRAVTVLQSIVPMFEEQGDDIEALILRGDILRLDPTPERQQEAEMLYHQAREMAEKGFASTSHKELRYALAKIYERIGNLVRKKATPQAHEEAGKWYRMALEMDEEYYRQEPCYKSRRSYAYSCRDMGKAALDRHTSEGRQEAEEWYKKALELDEKNYLQNPGYESRRSLSISFERLGVICEAKGTAEGWAEAESWFKKKLELDEENYRQNPGYESCRSLSTSYIRLGDICKAKGTAEGLTEAEWWIRKALELDEENYRQNPGYDSRRDLSISCNRLGDICKAKGTAEGLAEAEGWFRKSLELDEENYRQNPGYDSRRDLSVSCNRLGDICKAKGTAEGLAEAESWFRKALELIEENYRQNPGYDSRRDLNVSYNRLGDICKAKGTTESLAEAESWYRKMLELGEENFRQYPSSQSRNDLEITYRRLISLVREKPAQKADELEYWQKKLRAFQISCIMKGIPSPS